MGSQVRESDNVLMQTVAEYRLLPVGHLAELIERNVQSLRRRLTVLERKGIVEMASIRLEHRRGRPERIVSVGQKGVETLKDMGLLGKDVEPEQVTTEGIRCIEHELLVNDFRLAVVRLDRSILGLSHRFLAPLSPFGRKRPDKTSVIHERFRDEDNPSNWLAVKPDGVFSLTHSGAEKTLLFFLEADRANEPLASRTRPPKDFRHKILAYQSYFRLGRYRGYGRSWECDLKGFRVLVLASNPSRMGALCQLVRGLPPADFIWLTDQASLASNGLGDHIWVRGGRTQAPHESILGSKAPARVPAPQE